MSQQLSSFHCFPCVPPTVAPADCGTIGNRTGCNMGVYIRNVKLVTSSKHLRCTSSYRRRILDITIFNTYSMFNCVLSTRGSSRQYCSSLLYILCLKIHGLKPKKNSWANCLNKLLFQIIELHYKILTCLFPNSQNLNLKRVCFRI